MKKNTFIKHFGFSISLIAILMSVILALMMIVALTKPVFAATKEKQTDEIEFVNVITDDIELESENFEIKEVKHIEIPKPENRYAEIEISENDIDLMARIVYLESNTETFAGQRMVAEVILNRVLQGDMGGDNIEDVIFEKNQFSTAKTVANAEPNETNYQAVIAALYETPITDEDVVYFATFAHNDRVFCKIGGHYFCYR